MERFTLNSLKFGRKEPEIMSKTIKNTTKLSPEVLNSISESLDPDKSKPTNLLPLRTQNDFSDSNIKISALSNGELSSDRPKSTQSMDWFKLVRAAEMNQSTNNSAKKKWPKISQIVPLMAENRSDPVAAGVLPPLDRE